MGIFDSFKKTGKTTKPAAENKQTSASDSPNNLFFSGRWELYPRHIDGQPVIIRFDVIVGSQAEDVRRQYPHTLELRIPYEEAQENGLPLPSALDRLVKIEDAFSCGNYQVRFIGVLTGKNCRRFVFCYGGLEQDAEAIARTLMGKNHNVKYDFRVVGEDNFGYYESAIAPTAYDMQWITSRQICDSLKQHGETFTKPREIDFFCAFASEEHIKDVVAKLCEQGFQEVSCEKGEEGEYYLHLTLEGIPALDWITEITRGILDLLQETDGYFDGWGTIAIGNDEA